MNEQTQLIVETAKRILTDHCDKAVVDAAEQGNFPANLWQNLEDTGLTLAAISAEQGGSGGEDVDSLLVIRECAKFAAPIPVAETFIAAKLLEEAGQMVPTGPIAIASQGISLRDVNGSVVASGEAAYVGYGQHANHWLLIDDDAICLVASSRLTSENYTNLAGEPVSRCQLEGEIAGATLLPLSGARIRLLQLGAMVRVNQMAGAMASMLDMSVTYAMERSQFGRPIAKFQAIQQQLAILAGEVAACQRAADALLDDPTAFDIGVAKARVGEAVQQVTDIAHQVHGAIGYTREHGLNHRSRRLWLWRDSFGQESYWQHELGLALLESGADGLWAKITAV